VELLDRAVSAGTLSPRGVDKVLRVAWTVADLAGLDRPGRQELQVALAMRRGDSAEVADSRAG
jgi:magnesium chelatase family protein